MFGSLSPNERRPTSPETATTVQSGVVPGISAINGAVIVATLATILQIPILVAEKRVGKSHELPR